MRTAFTSSAKAAIALTLVVGTLFPTIYQNKAAATVSGAGWQAGNIIADPVFYDSTDMSVQQVQDFLNAQVPTCDTNGTLPATEFGRSDLTHAQYAQARGWSAPPYVCLKDYQENPTTHANNLSVGGGVSGGISAAQIIVNAARSYGISVRVLLTTLEKESSGPLPVDTWPLPSQYTNAMGYGCPDTAPCDPNYAGFYNQVTNAARQFYLYKANPNSYRYKPLQNNTILYSPNSACGSSTVYIKNYATAGLYIYTPYQPDQAALNNMYGSGDSCSSYGNRNFWRIFNDWFGTTQSSSSNCRSSVSNVTCVWSLLESDGTQFLTSSLTEMQSAITNFGWKYDGVAFYASSVQQTGTVPVHRLHQNNTFFYTTNQSMYSSMASSGWADEGIAFYVYPTTASSSASHQVNEYTNTSTGHNYWTDNSNQATLLLNSGYTLTSNTFNSFSPVVGLSLPAAGRDNIYAVKINTGYFYTTNLNELETLLSAGDGYIGIVTTANAAGTGTPVYRLQLNGKYFYTSDASERDNAINRYGYAYEGVGFYLDDSSAAIYRVDNTQDNTHYYTSGLGEVMAIANTGGWIYEGGLVNQATTDPSPVYRFLNVLNNRHFYTIDINEAARIANRGWKYETIAFSANQSSGIPVYRLLLYDKHFYTTDINERNIAVSKYGYTYEGVAFYVSPTTTNDPVYRLQGGPDEYFYTASTTERDRAVSAYKYAYEGTGFYLPQ